MVQQCIDFKLGSRPVGPNWATLFNSVQKDWGRGATETSCQRVSEQTSLAFVKMSADAMVVYCWEN